MPELRPRDGGPRKPVARTSAQTSATLSPKTNNHPPNGGRLSTGFGWKLAGGWGLGEGGIFWLGFLLTFKMLARVVKNSSRLAKVWPVLAVKGAWRGLFEVGVVLACAWPVVSYALTRGVGAKKRYSIRIAGCVSQCCQRALVCPMRCASPLGARPFSWRYLRCLFRG